MIRPKKMIPKLAVAMLALTGCGGDVNNGTGGSAGSGGTAGSGGSGGTAGSGGSAGTGGTGGSGGADVASAVGAWCMQLADCFPNSPYYQPTADCVSYFVPYYGLDGSISAACEAAAIGYFECGQDLSCDQLEMYSNNCDGDWEIAKSNCPDWP